MVADNLASHQIGGFKCGFARAYRKCRTCLGVDEEIQSLFYDSEFLIRTKKDHQSVCESMKVDELKSHFSWVYGVNRDSILNELKYFHVVGGLAPDVMHDLLEGVVPLVICDLLHHYIKKKFFSLDELNYAIENFNYGYSEVKDKPSIILMQHLKNRKLHQSASQKWLLFVLLPLLIGSRIGTGDRHWRCYKLLLRISRLLFSPKLSSIDLWHLGDLIHRFLALYKSCFKRRLTPKMHHMIHYPRYYYILMKF